MKRQLVVVVVIIILFIVAIVISSFSAPEEEVQYCQNLCGDGVCQEVVCLAIDCPCAETKKTCPEDCSVTSFEECAAAGNPVMESYPRQCRAESGALFVEDIGNELEKADLIVVDSPRPNQEISSPLVVKGRARGYWFFEGDFPVVLVDWDGLIIAQGIAHAKSEWMTVNFVEFEAVLEFEKPEYSNRGALILQKDNPSGLSINDDALEIPIIFK